MEYDYGKIYSRDRRRPVRPRISRQLEIKSVPEKETLFWLLHLIRYQCDILSRCRIYKVLKRLLSTSPTNKARVDPSSPTNRGTQVQVQCIWRLQYKLLHVPIPTQIKEDIRIRRYILASWIGGFNVNMNK